MSEEKSPELLSPEQSLQWVMEEYKQAFEQMRHYDKSRETLATFGLSFYSLGITIATALWTAIPKQYQSSRHILVAAVALAVGVGGLLVNAMFAQLRSSFVMVARQINGIRKSLIERSAGPYDNKNKLPTDPTRV